MTTPPEKPPAFARIEMGRRSPWLRIIIDDADFKGLTRDWHRWAGTAASTSSSVEPVGRREFSDRYRSWAYAYRLGDWANVILARTFLDAYDVQYEVVHDSSIYRPGYVILTDYFEPGCGTCPWRPTDDATTSPPEEFRCHAESRTCREVYAMNRAEINRLIGTELGAEPVILTEEDRRADGTPNSNVVLEFLQDSHRMWWRQDDETWTDGRTTVAWPDIEARGAIFSPFRPFTDPQMLLFAAVVERHPVARALLAGDVETWLRNLKMPDARQRALALVARLRPDAEADSDTWVIAAIAGLPMAATLAALTTPSREPAPQHLWEIEHPHHRDISHDDEDEYDTFDELKDGFGRRLALVYRWDWIDCRSPLLDGPDSQNPGLDELQVQGLSPQTGHLFTLRCPIRKDQEADVLAWLRGPRILGALRELWSPLLDPPADAPHHTDIPDSPETQP